VYSNAALAEFLSASPSIRIILTLFSILNTIYDEWTDTNYKDSSCDMNLP
jgi:hypothetical protein